MPCRASPGVRSIARRSSARSLMLIGFADGLRRGSSPASRRRRPVRGGVSAGRHEVAAAGARDLLRTDVPQRFAGPGGRGLVQPGGPGRQGRRRRSRARVDLSPARAPRANGGRACGSRVRGRCRRVGDLGAVLGALGCRSAQRRRQRCTPCPGTVARDRDRRVRPDGACAGDPLLRLRRRGGTERSRGAERPDPERPGRRSAERGSRGPQLHRRCARVGGGALAVHGACAGTQPPLSRRDARVVGPVLGRRLPHAVARRRRCAGSGLRRRDPLSAAVPAPRSSPCRWWSARSG